MPILTIKDQDNKNFIVITKIESLKLVDGKAIINNNLTNKIKLLKFNIFSSYKICIPMAFFGGACGGGVTLVSHLLIHALSPNLTQYNSLLSSVAANALVSCGVGLIITACMVCLNLCTDRFAAFKRIEKYNER